MLFTAFVLAAIVGGATSANVFKVESANIAVADEVQNAHPELFAAFQNTPLYTIDKGATRRRAAPRQAVPVDATPDPNRPIVTPENIFVLQCDGAGFDARGSCLVFGASPGDCVNYSSFNSSQAFLDEFQNKTSSWSTNTGGYCQAYKFIDCNNKGDDRGVTLSYNYNLAVATSDYGGDYDDQISSWRC